jgi:hypothetical protein
MIIIQDNRIMGAMEIIEVAVEEVAVEEVFA